jgi:hypothetical protein
MTCQLVISPDNSVVIEQTLNNPLTGFVNNATVTVDIKDREGNSIADMPNTLFYVAGSDGVYRQTFQTLDVTVNQIYTVQINAVTPEPLEFSCSVKVTAKARNC